MSQIGSKFYTESGLRTLVESPRDFKLVCLQRIVRMFSFGGTTLVLTLFLIGLGNTAKQVGLFMTLTLIGDVVKSLAMTVVADRIGRRNVLRFSSLLVIASGILFALSQSYWSFVLIGILGIISPGGLEIGPFKAIEESMTTQLVAPIDRSTALAWHSMSSTVGFALGAWVFGIILHVLHDRMGWEVLDSYRVVFWAYSGMGVVLFITASCLSPNCEVRARKASVVQPVIGEQQPLLAPSAGADDGEQSHGGEGGTVHHDSGENAAGSTISAPQNEHEEKPRLWKSLLPNLSTATMLLVARLCFLFMLDAFGSGIASQSWLIYFFHTKFGMEEERLGSLFFTTNILASASNLIAAALARRIGLVQTMVFTHLPASASLTILPFPSSQAASIGLLIFRAAITNMDQAPRQAFIASVVLPEERTTVMGVVSVAKVLAQSAGPLVTGHFADMGNFGYAFVVAGAVKCVYDILMSVMFMSHKPRKEVLEEEAAQAAKTPLIHEQEDGEDGAARRDEETGSR